MHYWHVALQADYLARIVTVERCAAANGGREIRVATLFIICFRENGCVRREIVKCARSANLVSI